MEQGARSLTEDRRPRVGRRIASRRAELNMSRNDLANETGLSYSYIAQIETGYRLPSIKQQWVIAKALGTSLDELFGDEEPPPMPDRLMIRPAAPHVARLDRRGRRTRGTGDRSTPRSRRLEALDRAAAPDHPRAGEREADRRVAVERDRCRVPCRVRERPAPARRAVGHVT